MTPDWALVYWTAGLTFATLILAFVAVFQDSLRSLFWKPNLKFYIDINSTDSQKTLLQINTKHERKKFVRSTKNYEIEEYYVLNHINAYYVRLRVLNYGNISARNVEVLLKDAYKLNEKTKSWIKLTNFSQDNLIWNTFAEEGLTRYNWDYISPDTFQYINFARILKPKERHFDQSEMLTYMEENLTTDISPKDEVLVSLQVFMRSTIKHYLLTKGTYKFKLIIAASNAKNYETFVKLKFNGKWDENPEIMFRDNLSLEMLP